MSSSCHVRGESSRTMKLPAALLILPLAVTAFAQQRYSFPDDRSVLDVKKHLGAKGDGKTDDTDTLQRALDIGSGRDKEAAKEFGNKTRVVFLPNGTYRLTKSLVVNSAVGPWLYGESRDGVVLKLDDGVKDVTAVLRTHPREKGPTSADWFMRNLRNFTVDAGNNPETDGIRYYATNTGTLKNVRVIGNGKVGINAGFLDQSGPNLMQDVEIDGFERGIQSQWVWGGTLSRVKIRNCRSEGIFVAANVLAIEDLTVEDAPAGIVNEIPNGWDFWGGIVAITGGKFSVTKTDGAAIINKGKLYARNIEASGFARAIDSNGSSGPCEGLKVAEFSSGKARKLWDNAPEASLKLPIKREPEVAWEHDHSKWLCVDDFGAVAGDNRDDSAAIEKAFAAAAKDGKTVVYFRGIGGGDPNWYDLDRSLRVPAPVRMVIGLGFGRVLDEHGKGAGFIVDDASAPLVKFQNLDSFGGPPVTLTNASSKSTLVVESCGVKVVGDGAGDIFLTDCPASVHLKRKGQSCWARHLNP
jgi:Pectate lyase superfamily protein